MFKKIVWVFLEKGSTTVIQFLSLIVLSRLLSPEDYGIYGIMMVFIALSDTLIDSGFGSALVHKNEVTQKDINTLFFTNATVSMILYSIIFLSGPLLENMYGINNLAVYFRVIGLVIISYAFSIVQNAMILRELRFKFSTSISITSSVSSSLIAIVMAYLGFGVWSLIAQVLSHSLIITIILWIKSRVRISFEISKNSFWDFFKFGSNLLGANILQTIVNNISNNIIPKIGSLQQSGLYFQATKLNSVPVNILTMTIDKSLFPILSREKDKESLLKRARAINRYFVTFIIPLFPLISYTAHPLVKIVLGSKWGDAAEYLAIIIWSGIALTFQCLSRNILKSLGFTKYILFVEIFKSAIILLVILISMNFGVLFLVWGVTGSSYIGAIIWSICLKKKAGYNYMSQVDDIFKTLMSIGIVYLTLYLLGIQAHTIQSLLIIPVGYILYLCIGLTINNKEITNTFRILRSYMFNLIMR